MRFSELRKHADTIEMGFYFYVNDTLRYDISIMENHKRLASGVGYKKDSDSILFYTSQMTMGCSCSDNPRPAKDNGKPTTSNQNDLVGSDSLKNKLSDNVVTISVSYAAISCGCPQWFEKKSKDLKFPADAERFYLEPASKDLVNANQLWDGEHLPLILRITGRFSKEKEEPVTYHIKGTPEKARIFWYDKITVISPSPESK